MNKIDKKTAGMLAYRIWAYVKTNASSNNHVLDCAKKLKRKLTTVDGERLTRASNIETIVSDLQLLIDSGYINRDDYSVVIQWAQSKTIEKLTKNNMLEFTTVGDFLDSFIDATSLNIVPYGLLFDAYKTINPASICGKNKFIDYVRQHISYRDNWRTTMYPMNIEIDKIETDYAITKYNMQNWFANDKRGKKTTHYNGIVRTH